MQDKKYISYRKYSNMFCGEGYDRKELSEKELTPFIKEHLGELKNIEIFTVENKVKVEINVNLSEVK